MRRLLILRRVQGYSMSPTLLPGQIIFATGLLRLRIGRIAIVENQGKHLIKRIKAIENEKIFLVGDNSHEHHNLTTLTKRVLGIKIF